MKKIRARNVERVRRDVDMKHGKSSIKLATRMTRCQLKMEWLDGKKENKRHI